MTWLDAKALEKDWKENPRWKGVINAMVSNQSEQGCTITMPIDLAQSGCRMLRYGQSFRHKGGHSTIDLTHDPPGGIHQRVVKINQPKRPRHSPLNGNGSWCPRLRW